MIMCSVTALQHKKSCHSKPYTMKTQASPEEYDSTALFTCNSEPRAVSADALCGVDTSSAKIREKHRTHQRADFTLTFPSAY